MLDYLLIQEMVKENFAINDADFRISNKHVWRQTTTSIKSEIDAAVH